MEIGRLSVVATPIGNMEDITVRALRIFKEVDYILCEDTRVTGKILAHYEIKAPLRRYDAHTSGGAHAAILDDLASGKHIALVSDAGTPGLSDPGVLLVAQARAAGVRIDAIPGPSALTALISIAGITGNQFTFMGFVPHKKGRQTFFADVASHEYPVVFFESTHRIMKTLQSLADTVPEHTVIVGRELTKLFEEVVSGTGLEVLEYFSTHTDKVRGEFVVLVTPK